MIGGNEKICNYDGFYFSPIYSVDSGFGSDITMDEEDFD